MFGAIWKFISNIFKIGEYKTDRAANDLMTNSPDGIRPAYDEAKNDLVTSFKSIVKAVSGIEASKSKLESRLKSLDEEEIQLHNSIEGILVTLEENPEDTVAIQDYVDSDNRQVEIDEEQSELVSEIEGLESNLESYTLDLNKIQSEIAGLEKESDKVVADMELMKMKEELEYQRQGITKNADMSAVNAVRKKLKERKGAVRTMERVSGTDSKRKMDKYASKGRSASGYSKLNEILKNRKSIKQAKKTGGNKISEENTKERGL